VSETVWLGLGGNVGDTLQTLTAAVFALDDIEGVRVEESSGVYETAPWPPPEDPRSVTQQSFLNLVVRVDCDLDPAALLAETQFIERAFGRDREREVRWGPRTLDIDLLLFGDQVIDTPSLTVPHPRLTERTFVLVPLLEVAPGGVLPDGRRLSRLLSELAPVEGIEFVVRLEDVPTRHLARPLGPAGGPAAFRRPGPDQDEARGDTP